MGHTLPLQRFRPRPVCNNTKATRDHPSPPTAHWAHLDLQAVGKALDVFTPLPCPARPTPSSLSRWFNISSTRLTSLLTFHAPSKRPCPGLQPWWSPCLLSLRREYYKFAKLSPLSPSPLNWSNVKSSRRRYFKAIPSAKRTDLADFLSSATLHFLWTAKGFAFGHLRQRFPDLPGASNPGDVPETLLHDFFPPKPPPTPRSSTSHATRTILPSPLKRYLGPSPNPLTPPPGVPTTSPTLFGSLCTASTPPFSPPTWTPC